MDSPPSPSDVLELHVLAFLMERPQHPYEIQRAVRQRHRTTAVGRPRALYHAVDRLVNAGLIEPAETVREGRRPERTVYRITDEGRAEFRSLVTLLLEVPQPEHPAFIVAMSFVPYLGREETLASLQQRVVALEGETAQWDITVQGLRDRIRMPRVVILDAELRHALRLAELGWLRGLIADLQSGQLDWDMASLARHFSAERERLGSTATTPPGESDAMS